MSFSNQSSPYETTPQDRLMGAVLVISIIIAIYSISKGSFLGSLTDERVKAHTTFSQSYGIMPGAEIKLSGIVVGHVEKVSLASTSNIQISVLLKPDYKHLYTVGSALKVNSGLGLDSVISGTGLEFIPGTASQQLMPSGSKIEAIEPQSIEEMLDQWNVKALATKAEGIVSDLAAITQTLVANQQQIVDTMQNMSTMTAATSELIASLPPVVANVDQLIVQLNTTVSQLKAETSGIGENVDALLTSSTDVTLNLNQALQDLQPVIEMLPSTISQVNRLSRQTTQLVNTLNNHWLLGGSDTAVTTPPSMLRYTGNDEIYQHGQSEERKEGN